MIQKLLEIIHEGEDIMNHERSVMAIIAKKVHDDLYDLDQSLNQQLDNQNKTTPYAQH